MTKNKLLSLLALSAVLLSACQPVQPADTTGNPDVNSKTAATVTQYDEVLPVLKVTDQGQAGDFKLRSQTSRYPSGAKTEMQITLTSSPVAYCQNESPVLKAGEESLLITIKAKNGKTPVSKAELANNAAYDLSGIYQNAAGEVKLAAADFTSLKITDLNGAIARGSLKISASNLQIEGEFFTAICQ